MNCGGDGDGDGDGVSTGDGAGDGVGGDSHESATVVEDSQTMKQKIS